MYVYGWVSITLVIHTVRYPQSCTVVHGALQQTSLNKHYKEKIFVKH